MGLAQMVLDDLGIRPIGIRPSGNKPIRYRYTQVFQLNIIYQAPHLTLCVRPCRVQSAKYHLPGSSLASMYKLDHAVSSQLDIIYQAPHLTVCVRPCCVHAVSWISFTKFFT